MPNRWIPAVLFSFHFIRPCVRCFVHTNTWERLFNECKYVITEFKFNKQHLTQAQTSNTNKQSRLDRFLTTSISLETVIYSIVFFLQMYVNMHLFMYFCRLRCFCCLHSFRVFCPVGKLIFCTHSRYFFHSTNWMIISVAKENQIDWFHNWFYS